MITLNKQAILTSLGCGETECAEVLVNIIKRTIEKLPETFSLETAEVEIKKVISPLLTDKEVNSVMESLGLKRYEL